MQTSYTTYRKIISIRRSLPIFFIFFQFIFGQFVGTFLNRQTEFYILLSTGLIYVYLTLFKSQQKNFLLVFVIGVFLTTNSNNYHIEITNKLSTYTGIVTKTPRARKVGKIDLSLYIPAISSYVDCSYIDYPWNSESENFKEIYKLGKVVAFSGRLKSVDTSLTNTFNLSKKIRGVTFNCEIEHITVELSPKTDIFFLLRNYILKVFFLEVEDLELNCLFASLVFGFRDGLSKETEESFKALGLMHLLVLSGYQLNQIFTFFKVLLRKVYCKLSFYKLFSVYKIDFFSYLTVFIFIIVCGIETSSLRALVALIVFQIGKLFNSRGSFLNLVLFTYLILSYFYPETIIDPSVHLTFAALIGIFISSYREFQIEMLGLNIRKNKESRYMNYLVDYFKVSFWIMICTSIVVWLRFEGVSPIAFIVNPIFTAIVSISSLMLGVLSITLSLVSLNLAQLPLRLACYLLDLWRESCLFIEQQQYLKAFFSEYAKNSTFLFCCCCLLLRFSRPMKLFKSSRSICSGSST